MNKQIKLSHNGVEYILEFDRMTIKMLESAGFVLDEFMAKPMTNVDLVFSAAFIKHHKKISQETVDEIFNGCKNVKLLIGNLTSMIRDCYESLLSDDKEGNVTWEMVDLTPKK